jgi:hypothetical protein
MVVRNYEDDTPLRGNAGNDRTRKFKCVVAYVEKPHAGDFAQFAGNAPLSS